MQRTTKIGLVICLAITLATVAAVYAIATNQLTVPTNGSVTDSTLQATPSAVDWGTTARGTTVTRTINLTNNSAANSRPLNLTTAQTVGNLTWNAEAYTLLPHQTVNVTLTLTVADNASSGPFSFPLYITG